MDGYVWSLRYRWLHKNFGAVISSDDEPVRCEAHATTIEESALRPKQTRRPLEHLGGLNRVGPSELGLGLGLGDDSRVHEVLSSSSQILDPVPVSRENSGNLQDGQGVSDVGIVPSCSNHSSPAELNGVTPVSVDGEISRLKEVRIAANSQRKKIWHWVGNDCVRSDGRFLLIFFVESDGINLILANEIFRSMRYSGRGWSR